MESFTITIDTEHGAALMAQAVEKASLYCSQQMAQHNARGDSEGADEYKSRVAFYESVLKQIDSEY
jgi:hypothetical protein